MFLALGAVLHFQFTFSSLNLPPSSARPRAIIFLRNTMRGSLSSSSPSPPSALSLPPPLPLSLSLSLSLAGLKNTLKAISLMSIKN